MFRSLPLALFVAALGAVAVSACAGPDGDEDLVSSEEALRARVDGGQFKLYDQPHANPNPDCDVHTALDLAQRSNGAHAKLTEALDGFCEIHIEPNTRSYRLRQLPDSCGSKIFEGQRRTSAGLSTIRISDHRTRTCRDLVPAKIIVDETFGGVGVDQDRAITTTKYSFDGAPPPPPTCDADADCGAGNVCRPGLCRMMCLPGQPNCCAPNRCEPAQEIVTVEGTMTASVGIGGENTGASLATSTGFIELILDDAERSLFQDGKKAKVTGRKTALSGVETQNRPAIDVSKMLVCPNPGTTINCMPRLGIPGMPSMTPEACSETGWISANCPGVDFTF